MRHRLGTRWLWLVAATAAATFAWNLAYAEGTLSSALTPAQIAERTIPSVVLIRVPGGLGSGFIAGDGRVVTNLHVLGGAREATVVLADGRELKNPELLAADEQHDLLVLRVSAANLKALPLGDSSRVRAGDRVVVIGHPLGLSNTVSDGLVSAVREVSPGLSVLQLTAPISPGSSGGPLLDDRGQVIGISTLLSTRGQNVNFAIPINAVKPLLLQTKATPLAKWKPPAQAKAATRAVPHHELSLLHDCSSDDIDQIGHEIATAISIGAPIYNQGDVEGCYRVYANTAIAIDRKVTSCVAARKALLDGVRRADQLTSFSDKAWAMRDAFDGLLDVMDRFRQVPTTAAQRSLPPAPARNVPHHALKLLDGCSATNVDRIARAIESAISVGAPLYNEGNFEACFRIYEGVALEVQRSVPACSGAKRALNEGVKEAAARNGWVDKAWAMRDAFDGLLDVSARKLGGEE
jgi:serine protease Do